MLPRWLNKFLQLEGLRFILEALSDLDKREHKYGRGGPGRSTRIERRAHGPASAPIWILERTRPDRKKHDSELLHELIRCVRAIANTKVGDPALHGPAGSLCTRPTPR